MTDDDVAPPPIAKSATLSDEPRACANCGEPLSGRKRKFCNRECQVAALERDRTSTAIRFDPDVHEQMRAWCDTTGLSMTWLVNQLCREGMNAITPADKFSLTRKGTS